jgi:hypothetical protein
MVASQLDDQEGIENLSVVESFLKAQRGRKIAVNE